MEDHGVNFGKPEIRPRHLTMQRIKKILVIKLRAIGDVVLSTAVLPNLKSAFPDAALHFLVETPGVEVIAGNPHVDRVIELPRKAWEKLSPLQQLIAGGRFFKNLRRERYDMVFDLFGNPRSALLTLATGSPLRVGYTFRFRKAAYNKKVIPRGHLVHEVEFNLDALRAMNIPTPDGNIHFPLSVEANRKIDRWITESKLNGHSLAGFHVWGSWQAKRWDPVRWASLADRLINICGMDVILLWGPGEKEYALKVLGMMKYRGILAPQTTLKELGGLISRCSLVVANDSGPMHISAAVGTPTVGIYGPTSWKNQGPWGTGHSVAFKEGLTCLGCNRLTCDHLTCMRNLDTGDVFDVIQKTVPHLCSGKTRKRANE